MRPKFLFYIDIIFFPTHFMSQRVDQLNAFSSQMKLIKDYVKSDKTEPQKKGKITAKVLTLYCKVFNKKSENDIKHILAQYRVRETREGEQRRQQDYLKDFDYKSSAGYKLIESMIVCKDIKDWETKKLSANYLKFLIDHIVEEEKKNGRDLKINRAAARKKAGLYKFITENLEIFQGYKENGTFFEIK